MNKMQHIAIMQKKWHFIEKILTGEKTIESRWYLKRQQPWGSVTPGDAIYFKNAGELVIAKAKVKSVLQYEQLTYKTIHKLLDAYASAIGLRMSDIPVFYDRVKDKHYAIFIFLENPEKIRIPFAVSKKGYGMMSAWITKKTLTD